MNNSQFVAELAKLKPSSTFLTVKGYRNEASEIADYSIVFNISYRSALEKSIAILQEMNLTSELEKYARDELVESHNKSLVKIASLPLEEIERGYQRFFDENDNHIKGIKLHIASNTLHLYGLVVHKRVLMPGEYGTDLRKRSTVVKDKLRYLTPVGKFRQFKITPAQVDAIKVQNLSLLPPV
jgi:hypothetical protein